MEVPPWGFYLTVPRERSLARCRFKDFCGHDGLVGAISAADRENVVQLVRTLLSHRHNDLSDLKISNLVQPTSVRPVTASAISLHFRKLVVRFLEVPDCLP